MLSVPSAMKAPTSAGPDWVTPLLLLIRMVTVAVSGAPRETDAGRVFDTIVSVSAEASKSIRCSIASITTAGRLVIDMFARAPFQDRREMVTGVGRIESIVAEQSGEKRIRGGCITGVETAKRRRYGSLLVFDIASSRTLEKRDQS